MIILKVLHALTSNKLSGAENVVADICMMFENEYEMVYCSPDGQIRKDLQDRGVNFIPLRKLNVFELIKVVKKFNPDIIHAHDVKATLISTVVSGKIPVISHLHGNSKDMTRITIKSILYFLSSLKVKKIIGVSESCIEEYVLNKFIKNKAIVLKNIIYEKRLNALFDKDINNYDFDFIFLGRLSYAKNPERVAKVASKVLKCCPNAKFGVIGEGELKDEMIKVFKSEGVIDRVTFTGKLPYPYKALKSSKCLLMCSRYEGLPIAALEAMALGVPVVSTPVDGLKEIIINGENGFLSDLDHELVDYVIEILSDKNRYSYMTDACKRFFKENNKEKLYKNALLELYNSTLEQKYNY
ncbi:glycosyltransferase [Caloramator sp. CAR-1]|uniref:glycosyltransferase n=1 Tax=Caloramator sp. CAR-1 TaxID=3062777 RepID=UPI0026E1F412|nr:glycosyltransferase [Caloramator sp. CAR-1]MDO6355733.1 glycosyltransferase [Caloramator sp. CAR-1]